MEFGIFAMAKNTGFLYYERPKNFESIMFFFFSFFYYFYNDKNRNILRLIGMDQVSIWEPKFFRGPAKLLGKSRTKIV